MAATTKKTNEETSKTKTGSILQSLEGFHMVDKDIIKMKTLDGGTIWDTPEEQHGKQNSDNGNATAL